MTATTENAVQTPLTVQTQVVPENQMQNQQGGGGGFRGRGRGRGVQNGGCFKCGQMSHWSNECPQNQLQQPQAPQYFPTPFQQPQTQPYYPQFQQQQTPVYVPTQSQPPAPGYTPVQYQQRGGHSVGSGFQGQPRGGGVSNMNLMPPTAWYHPQQ